MIRAQPGTNAWTWPVMLCGSPCTTKKPSSASPASSGRTRQARGGLGVTFRVTPSGDRCTRRSASLAAAAAAAGTPAATIRMSGRLSERSPGKNGAPVNGIAAIGTRNTKNSPKPAATPRTAASVDSTAAIIETCRRVAPASRIAANRCSRRAADSLVAVVMKISTGNSIASATTGRTRSIAFALMPRPSTQLSPVQPFGGVAEIAEARTAPGACESCAAVSPAMTTSEFGDGSAAAPIVPACRPGYRSPSSSLGVSWMSLARAGEA